MDNEEKTKQPDGRKIIGTMEATMRGTSKVVGHLIGKRRTEPNERRRLLRWAFCVWLFVFLLAHLDLFYRLKIPWLNVPFAEGFWPNFIADIGVGLGLAWFLNEVLEDARTRDLELEPVVVTDDRGTGNKGVEFYVVNSGHESFLSSIFYHIFIRSDAVMLDPHESKRKSVFFGHQLYWHYEGVVIDPFYPRETRSLQLRLAISDNLEPSVPALLYYYFFTEYGTIPRNLELYTNNEASTESMKSITSL